MKKSRHCTHRKTDPHHNLQTQHEARTVRRMVAVAGAAGFLAGWARYKQDEASLANQSGALQGERALNSFNHCHVCRKSARTYSKAIKSSTAYDQLLYRLVKASGGEAAGELQWMALHSVLYANNVPFSASHVDVSDPYFLGPRTIELARSNPGLARGIARWKEIRSDLLSEEIPRRDLSEETLLKHVTKELELTARGETIQSSRDAMPFMAAITGAVAGGGFIGAICLAVVILRFRAKRLARKAKIEDEQEAVSPPPALPIHTPKAGSPAKPGITVHQAPAEVEKKQRPSDPDLLRSEARSRLAADFGDLFADAALGSLNGRFSNRLARQIIAGEYAALARVLQSSKKALETAGYDADSLVETLLPRKEEARQNGAWVSSGQKRKWHPLDGMKRWGWERGAFHRLLRSWGFDTSEVGGGGHCFVKYSGQKLRTPDGRFIQIPHATRAYEVPPGAASQVLKACADFLAEKGQSSPKKRNSDPPCN